MVTLVLARNPSPRSVTRSPRRRTLPVAPSDEPLATVVSGTALVEVEADPEAGGRMLAPCEDDDDALVDELAVVAVEAGGAVVPRSSGA